MVHLVVIIKEFMNSKIFLVALFFVIPWGIEAQDLKEGEEQEQERFLNYFTFGSYFDNGLHPGVKIGLSHVLGSKIKSRQYRFKSRGSAYGPKTKSIKYLLDGNVGMYTHPNNHIGTFVGFGFTRLRTEQRKLRTLAWSFGVNYLRRFYNIETYTVSENGKIEKVSFAGTNSLMFNLTPSFGKEVASKNDGQSWRWYIAPSLQFLKYNHSFFPNASLEIGATINLNRI